VKWSADDTGLVPAGEVTVTSTAPAAPAGATAVIEVAELTVKLVAGVVPKRTEPTSTRPEPVMWTEVPPATAPWYGATLVIAGLPRS
jgi:hypothetical protein